MKPPIAIICLPEPENACFGHRDAIYTAAECASIVSLGLFLAVFFIYIFYKLFCHNLTMTAFGDLLSKDHLNQNSLPRIYQ